MRYTYVNFSFKREKNGRDWLILQSVKSHNWFYFYKIIHTIDKLFMFCVTLCWCSIFIQTNHGKLE